jgi:hypothetical protein
MLWERLATISCAIPRCSARGYGDCSGFYEAAPVKPVGSRRTEAVTD